jgi:hypothetical protein
MGVFTCRLLLQAAAAAANIALCSAVHADPLVERVYPSSWTEVSPGSFVYNYTLGSQDSTTLSLAIGDLYLGQLQLNNIGAAPAPSSNSSQASRSAVTSNVTVAAPTSPVIGSSVTANIFLNDESGNPAPLDELRANTTPHSWSSRTQEVRRATAAGLACCTQLAGREH